MSLPDVKDVNSEYVKAICDYEYIYKDQNISMSTGEIFLLLKRSTDDWWQVIRKGEKRPFYAPRQYLDFTKVPAEVMKSSLRKKLAHQRHLQHQQRLLVECKRETGASDNESVTNFIETQDENETSMPSVPAERKFEPPLVVFNPIYQKDACLNDTLVIDERQDKYDNHLEKSHQNMNDNISENGRIKYDNNPPTSDSFEETCDLDSSEREVNNSSYGMLSTSSELDCSSACTSFSSLNDYPLNYQSRSSKIDESDSHEVAKTASCDVLQARIEQITKENIKQQRAASSEELDNRHLDYFRSNLLNQNSRSNSVDLKRCNNNLDLSTFHKFNSMEKQKFRLSKDPMNRRRSWALNENYHSSSNFVRYKIDRDDPLSDADLPPKLPPKLKDKFNILSRSTDNLNNVLPRTANGAQKTIRLPAESLLTSSTDNHYSTMAMSSSSDRIPPKTLPRRIIPGITVDNVNNKVKDKSQVAGKFKDASKQVIQLQKEGKGKRVEELIEQLENKSKLQKTQPVKKITSQRPPSPDEAPLVMLMGNWGKYIEKETRMPFYYNAVTGERRWKPPRRSAPASDTFDRTLHKKLENDGDSYGPTKSASVSRLAPSNFLESRQSSYRWDQPCRRDEQTSSRTKQLSSTCTLPTKPNAVPVGSVALLNASFPGGSTVSLDKDGSALSCDSPTTKQHKSIFSTISSSLSFMKSPHAVSKSASSHSIRSLTPPQVPSSSLKPASFPVTPGGDSSPVDAAHLQSMQTTVEQFQMPAGWLRKYDALSQQIYFHSLLTGEKHGEGIMGLPDTQTTASQSLKGSIMQSAKEDYITWCWYYREGKKQRKNWSLAWLQYFPEAGRTSHGKTYGILLFSKSPDDRKKVEVYRLLPPCVRLEENGRTTSRENVIALKNNEGNIVLLQTKDEKLYFDWVKCFVDHNRIQLCPLTPDKDRKHKKTIRRDSKDEAVSPSEKGLKDILLSFLKRRPMQETLINKGIYKEAVFGSTIAELCTKDGTFIPLFVLKCINCIERRPENFTVEGLYRIPGNAPRIQKIRFEIAQNRYGILEEEKDVHNLSGALKLFFRELKGPLVPFANYRSFIQAAGSECLEKFSSRTEALKDALQNLPRCNHDTLKILLEHLLKVNAHEKTNRMSLMNLAIVFGPCLLWPETAFGFDLMTDVMLQNRVVEALLSDYQQLYSGQ